MPDKNKSSPTGDEEVFSTIIAEPEYYYKEYTIPQSIIYTRNLLAHQAKLNETLQFVAEKQAEIDNLARRQHYIKQQIEKAQKRLKEENLTPHDVDLIQIGLSSYNDELDSIGEQLSKNREELEKYNESLTRKTHYDKKTLFKNIRYLLTETNVKINQIEREARGCQPGYQSKLEKPDNTTEPTLEYAVTAATKLGVSLDVLLHSDYASLTPTEIYLIQFFLKLERDTTDNKLEWKIETAKALNAFNRQTECKQNHPLFTTVTMKTKVADGSIVDGPTHRFRSNSFRNKTIINNDCFNLKLKNGATLYLMNVREEGKPDPQIIEAWMCHPDQRPTFICSTKEHQALVDSLSHLYNTLIYWAKRPRIEKSLKTVIDAFMNDELD